MNHTHIRRLEEGDLAQLFRLRKTSFLDFRDPDDPQVKAQQLARLPYSLGLFDNAEADGRLLSSLTLYPFQMNFAGELKPFAGLASVMSAAEARRRGHVKTLLKRGLETVRDQGVGWCLEFPFDARYYGRFGWQSVPNGTTLRLPCERLFRAGPADLRQETDLATLKRVHMRWSAHYNLAMHRDARARPAWDWLVKPPWSDRERLVFVREDAYAVLELSSEGKDVDLELHDYAYTTPAGRREILAFLGTFQGQVKTVSLHVPCDDPLAWDHAAFQTKNDSFQARIVDVKTAFEQLTAASDRALTLAVDDGFCEWNRGSFEIISENGSIEVNPSRQEAGLRLDIRSLAALLSGSLSAEAARQLGMFEGDFAAAEWLASLSGGRTPFMPLADYF